MKQSMFIAVLFIIGTLSSCLVDPETISVWGGDMTVPELASVHTLSAREVSVEFTDTVSVSSALVECPDDPGRIIGTSWNAEEDSNTVIFTLSENPGIGVSAVLNAAVRDARGNSLSFSVLFIGYNERVPRLLINEIRTGYDKPKVEYMELVVLSDGNLAGVQIENAMNSKQCYYEFPFCEVRAGDYVLWHLRSVEEGLVTESDRMDASAGKDSSPFAWDFWDVQDRSPLKSTNVLLVRERSGGPVMDALLCAETDKSEWPSDALRLAAETAVSAGVWGPTALITDAACSDYMTPTRTLGRIPGREDTNSASDWMVCANSGASPGTENSVKPYEPK
ncbi:MAG TPA: hypothetical protein P5286_00660 [Treponemataceae bacterium]|nr:hypothetical protein [Treponemataceae bacterium]